MQHPADKVIRDMLREKDKRIADLEAEIIRAGKVIKEADALYEATQPLPTAGSSVNRNIAEKARQYKIAKDKARGEQEG